MHTIHTVYRHGRVCLCCVHVAVRLCQWCWVVVDNSCLNIGSDMSAVPVSDSSQPPLALLPICLTRPLNLNLQSLSTSVCLWRQTDAKFTAPVKSRVYVTDGPLHLVKQLVSCCTAHTGTTSTFS